MRARRRVEIPGPPASYRESGLVAREGGPERVHLAELDSRLALLSCALVGAAEVAGRIGVASLNAAIVAAVAEAGRVRREVRARIRRLRTGTGTYRRRVVAAGEGGGRS